jgi:hypothetical protein
MTEKIDSFRQAAIRKSKYSYSGVTPNSFHAQPKINLGLADENSNPEFSFEFKNINEFITALRSLNINAPNDHSTNFANQLFENLGLSKSSRCRLEIK